MKAPLMLLLGTALAATAVWLNDYGHSVVYGPFNDRRVGFVQPEWADPAAAAAAIIGGALIVVGLTRLMRKSAS